MKNDWYYIFGFEQAGVINDNLAIALEFFLKDFIFKKYDNKGNIIVISKKDFKEHKIMVGKPGFLNFNLKTCVCNSESEEKLFGELEVLRYHHDKENGNYDALFLGMNTKKITNFKDSAYFEIVKKRINYFDSNCNEYEGALITTQKHFLRNDLKSNYVIPDVVCSTSMQKCKNDVSTFNKTYKQKFELNGEEFSYKSFLPILNLLIDEHELYLKKFSDQDKDLKKNFIKTHKIGF